MMPLLIWYSFPKYYTQESKKITLSLYDSVLHFMCCFFKLFLVISPVFKFDKQTSYWLLYNSCFSFVRSVTMDKWKDIELEKMKVPASRE